MKAKTLIMIGMVVGSSLGGYLPALWGAGGFSMSSVVFGAVGGVAGIWAGFKLSRM
jgi:outer membrane lipoprotein SlyB